MQDTGAQDSDGRELARPPEWRARIESRLANTRPRHAVEDDEWSRLLSRVVTAFAPTRITAQTGAAR